jgi:hypothetical protein
MGTCPQWYRLIRAAIYLGVAPWELAERPLSWVHMAEAAQDAEAHARAIAEKQHRQHPN